MMVSGALLAETIVQQPDFRRVHLFLRMAREELLDIKRSLAGRSNQI